MTLVFVALAGAVGACLRLVVDEVVEVERHDPTGRRFPWGVLVVNTTGSLVLGLVAGLALYHGFTGRPKVVIGTGFCGAYTTFSTFAFDVVRLGEDGHRRASVAYLAASAVLTLAAAAAGLALAAAL